MAKDDQTKVAVKPTPEELLRKYGELQLCREDAAFNLKKIEDQMIQLRRQIIAKQQCQS
jgi:hypothetical protein